MKKIWIWLLITVLLTGCSAGGSYETLGTVPQEKPPAPMAKVTLALPEEAAENVWQTEEGTFYDCQGYTLSLQTFASGDLPKTVQTLSGFRPDKLTVLESGETGCRRYDWVWIAAGADGDVLCRAAVIDDGNYHYCLSAMALAGEAGDLTETWNGLFGSFRLET